MLELALLTVPGPFAPMTHRLGRFIGVKQDGQLIAMAGERMSMPGFREVSGVCTHPDHRGQGYAQALMAIITQRILDEGDTPFLHAYATNRMAIELYERLGWQVRAPMITAILSRCEA
ncbi:GNAT family N-acetyltransferase [Allosphingosinicella flava]|nr:GNAT family N-acetyltransferase [Sphingosinicella flava]